MAHHDDPAAAWDRYDKLADEMTENAYEARRNQLVADAAAGDPGEADEENWVDPGHRDDDNEPSDEFKRVMAQGAEQAALDDAQGGATSDDDDEGSDTDPNATSAFTDRLVAFLEDLRDYLQAKPACADDPEAVELVERAEDFIDGLA